MVPGRGKGSPVGQALTGRYGVDQLLAGERSEPAVWRDEKIWGGEGRGEGFLPLLHRGEDYHDQTLREEQQWQVWIRGTFSVAPVSSNVEKVLLLVQPLSAILRNFNNKCLLLGLLEPVIKSHL